MFHQDVQFPLSADDSYGLSLNNQIFIFFFRIKNFLVFCITAAFSIFAYIWLIIVLVWASPGKVEIWEAVLTFLFFPILVCVAYAGDKGYLDALFCQKNAAKLTNKQQQLELGNVQSGECKYIVPGLDSLSSLLSVGG